MSTTTAPAAAAQAAQAPALSGALLARPLMAMLSCAAAEAALAIYQWMELLDLNKGGVPLCNINSTLNCGAVWNSPFAHTVHEHLGIPVAGLGVVFGVTAFALSLALTAKVLKGEPAGGLVAALRIWGAVGALSCITFAVASFQAGALCVTCLGTYALAVGFFGGTLMIPGEKVPNLDALMPGLPALFVFLGLSYAAVLYPGLKTPKPAAPTALTATPEQVEDYFKTLPEQEKLATSYARNLWQQATTLDTSRYPVHHLEGPADAPVKLVEFTDILCPHCANLLQTLDEMKRAAPAGSFSVEPRYFPLDGECNPNVKQSSGDGVRCLGAKVQICLEGTPSFHDAQLALFGAQKNLSPALLMEIASHGMPREQLQQCIASPATEARLQEDIAYAMATNPDGTPILLLNGRVTPPARSFVYGMVMAKGDPNAKLFQQLPPPPRE